MDVTYFAFILTVGKPVPPEGLDGLGEASLVSYNKLRLLACPLHDIDGVLGRR